MNPPGGGFLRPGSQSGSAFGVKFDRPPQGGSRQRSDQRLAAAAFDGSKRRRVVGDQRPIVNDKRDGTSSSDDDGPGPSGRLPDGMRGPDLPPMNPTYRYGDPSLPVSKYRRQILYLVETHATTIILGETGSGKSTQVPQFLMEAGWAEGGFCIAVTQPRRVAAASVAARVAEEVGCDLGTTVGYAVRFDNALTPGRTRIKYLTDGVLVREMMDDPLLSSYSVIMVDEAHERSLATDMLLGLLKKVQKRRPDLRLIISSATLEADKLREFFESSSASSAAAAAAAAARAGGAGGGGAGAGGGGEVSRSPAVLSVEGRTHPVQVHYLSAPAPDYVTAAVEAAVAIHCEDMPGDILIFLTGQEEVCAAVSLLEEQARRLAGSRGYGCKMLPLPLYAGLPGPQQQAALRPPPRGFRKVVAATNVAETSLTLEGVVYVIDGCFLKLRCYNPLTGLESLLTAPLSRAGAAQRAGRAGRVRAGHCFRLCTEEDFGKLMPAVTVPEMQRSNLTGMLLQLKALGIDNVMRFEWLAPPPAEAMVRALEELHALRVLDDDARLTREVGLPLCCLPLDPGLGCALLASLRLGCCEELLTLAAMMGAGGGAGGAAGVWLNAAGATRALDEAKARFAAAEGDAVTLLNVHRGWRGSGRSAAWAQRHMLSASALYRADAARDQLLGALRRAGLLPAHSPPPSCQGDMEPVCRALACGLFPHSAVWEGQLHNPLAAESDPGNHCYRLLRYTDNKAHPIKLRIHASSVLRRSAPACVVFTAVQQYAGGGAGGLGSSSSGGDGGWFEMQGVTAIRPEWLPEIAPHMFHKPEPGRG